MKSKFYIGQKVICVNDKRKEFSVSIFFPSKGVIYTIRSIELLSDGFGVELEEIINPLHLYSDGLHEPKFDEDRFRPVGSISIEFSQLVNKELCSN